MSRIGRKPVEIPKGVQVSITKDVVSVKGPKGTLSLKRNRHVEVKQAKDEDQKDVVLFERAGQDGQERQQDETRQYTRGGEVLHGIDTQTGQCIELFRYSHGGQLRCHR